MPAEWRALRMALPPIVHELVCYSDGLGSGAWCKSQTQLLCGSFGEIFDLRWLLMKLNDSCDDDDATRLLHHSVSVMPAKGMPSLRDTGPGPTNVDKRLAWLPSETLGVASAVRLRKAMSKRPNGQGACCIR